MPYSREMSDIISPISSINLLILEAEKAINSKLLGLMRVKE
jgi:hypothetical protein